MLTKQEAKLAFLRKCASLGLNADQILRAAVNLKAAVEKRADEAASPTNLLSYLNPMSYLKGTADTGKSVVDFGGAAAKNIGLWGVAAPMGLAAAGGIAGGSLLAKATAPQQDPEEVRNQEVADTYRQYADYLKQRAETARLQQTTKFRSPSLR